MNAVQVVIPFLFIFAGMIPILTSFGQFLLVGLHGLRNNYDRCEDYTPRVAFIVPAWNEADVIAATIDSLMSLSYPKGTWRIYVVDDASTDDTPAVLRRKAIEYPGSIFHLRREVGGQGKAHTLNHGLRAILSDDWAEAVMIMDADVLFEPLTLRRMTRHLANPEIGAVTAYVKEGSQPGNLITRFIAFEYITAQAAARRAQNVAGVLACLAGGAQLHSRDNLVAIGGEIDTSSLAEDTFTTFRTQLAKRRVVFDGNAVVWAEEPDTLVGLWKQRLRWARGNLQLTVAFRHLWFRRGRYRGLGNIGFGLLWFSIVFMPIFMILGAIGLIGLYHWRPDAALSGFAALWGTTIAVYLFETLFSFAIDPATGRRAWLEALIYPGLISLTVMILFFLPAGRLALGAISDGHAVLPWTWQSVLTHFVFAWGGLSMAAAWGVYRLERAGAPRWLRDLLLVLIGYGPLMAAISLAALVAQLRGLEARWEKTVKSGKARILK